MGCVFGTCCGLLPPSPEREKKTVSEEAKIVLSSMTLNISDIPSHGFRLASTVLTQHGFPPADRENQDRYCIETNIQGNPNVHFYGVFDGHGKYGHHCAAFVKDRLIEILSNDGELLDYPDTAYGAAFLTTNEDLHRSGVDDSISGTTATTVLVVGDMIYVANVGDSRAVLAVKEGDKLVAEDLSWDQTPFRDDECERVKRCGARVLTTGQIEGFRDRGSKCWEGDKFGWIDPPRLWLPDIKHPGVTFTRSLGDTDIEKIGAIADPEVKTVKIQSNHAFFVIASDGVFKFLSSQDVVDLASKYYDPRDACFAIVREASRLWAICTRRIDDITAILVQIKDHTDEASSSGYSAPTEDSSVYYECE